MSKTLIIGTIAIVLLAFTLGGLFLWQMQPSSPAPAQQPVQQTSPPPAPSLVPSPAPLPLRIPLNLIISESTVENSYMKVDILPGWRASQMDWCAVVNGDYSDCVKAGVKITKENYILQINPLFQHASGVVGGRFSEVADGMPVMKNIPLPAGGYECASIESRAVTKTLMLQNYYTDSSKKEYPCVFPIDNTPRWFLSLAHGEAEVVFGRYVFPDIFNEYAISLTFMTTDVNRLPEKDSEELKQILSEVDSMLKTLFLK